MAVDQNRTFAVVLKPDDEGGFVVRVPALPEIVTYGKNKGEALAMAKDAIRLVMADCVARGEVRLTDEQVAEIRRRRADPNRRLVSHAEARKRIKRLGAF
ncbi:MAG TPA: type II toxin-antitoxin system HicB family antitoxin [Pseudolabrys sp.]|nr:type II toxin-antitoxin system HicB family antitoxin [Pseudolabrys sp.]